MAESTPHVFGWHCACGDKRYGVPVWNNAHVAVCWNCGKPPPLSGRCPINCGCYNFEDAPRDPPEGNS